MGTGKFKGKLPFKFFACGRVGHDASKCAYKENHDKKENEKDVENKNAKNMFLDKKSIYSNEDHKIKTDDQEN